MKYLKIIVGIDDENMPPGVPFDKQLADQIAHEIMGDHPEADGYTRVLADWTTHPDTTYPSPL